MAQNRTRGAALAVLCLLVASAILSSGCIGNSDTSLSGGVPTTTPAGTPTSTPVSDTPVPGNESELFEPVFDEDEDGLGDVI